MKCGLAVAGLGHEPVAMKLFATTSTTTITAATVKNINVVTVQPLKTLFQYSTLSPINIKLTNSKKRNALIISSSLNPNSSSISSSCSSSTSSTTRAITDTATETSDFLPSASSSSSTSDQHHWIVVMEKPVQGLDSKSEIIDYYVKTLARVLGSEKEAQMCIYNASWQTHFGFCCDIEEEISLELSRLPEVLSVRPDPDFESVEKDYSLGNVQLGRVSNSNDGISRLFSEGNSKYWLVRMEKPAVEVVTKAQMVDYYAQILTKVLGNEKDAQMCIYHVSWKNNFGFCCELDEECARELVGVPGVLSVQSDKNFGSDNKDYVGDEKSADSLDSSDTAPNIKTKRLFITGLSFYTSEKTLRAAFEGFGELVEVKIIMDKISKRSKGYAFIEYTTEEAAAAALKEMNGKIINGWMIVVDVAKTNPPKYSRGRPRPTF
ncbi:RNA recognition motif domain [Macleaya cordata]|uniref:Organelle RRM domain-containing protein 1, chloroplastic n=1 Tax=Macleaya cordata TaxID=56857 RepID=A0A200PZF5_MACCD|nr:RNA recognition motif domain [Macleaya cordata]